MPLGIEEGRGRASAAEKGESAGRRWRRRRGSRQVGKTGSKFMPRARE